MTYTAAADRMARLQRTVQAAASQLHAMDAATVERIGLNLHAYEEDHLRNPLDVARYAGLFSVNLDECLDIIERLTRP